MRSALLFAASLLVAPGAAFAQSEAEVVLPVALIAPLDTERAPVVAAAVPSEAERSDRASEPDDPEQPSRVGRIGAELALGASGMFVAGGTSGGLGLLVGIATTPSSADFIVGPAIGVVVGGLIGAPFGTALGVYGAGQAMNGDGGFGWTFLGTLAGETAGLLTALAGDAGAMSLVLTPVLALAGAVVGYEASSPTSRSFARSIRRTPRDPQAAFAHVMPTLASAGRGGALLGLGGTF